ncbi:MULTISPECIES: hypothetical protein [unclassified Aureimonas]|uniref:hypothetical protein n=1 Tax=unclassified Aureimonas TaxID=2615206 RepID=UPI0006F89DFF|nr:MULTISPECIES: hypothetical protein [unclassified Aureimonas]KQT52248.1 hypothetical protein ASG62_16460 [Aureimonas sp. Leaf427]KQT65748.1 hypothetical protein ASG54_22600 [Aureimonas sp. Leaf460]
MKALGPDFEPKLSAFPADLQSEVRAWIEGGTLPGKFLQGVLSNDLAAAVYRGRLEHRLFLVDLVRFLDWECPNDCWGSPQIMAAWAAKGGLSCARAMVAA